MSAVEEGTFTTGVGRRAEGLLLGATLITWLGNSINLTACALLLVHTEGSSAAVGWLMMTVAVPQALLSAVFGRIADRLDRRTLCVSCDLISTVIAIALPVSLRLGADPATAVYLTMFLLTCVFAMNVPAFSAMIKERVASQRLVPFNANYEIALQAGTLLSTAIGGFAVQAFGTNPVFVFNGLTYLASAVFVAAIGRRRVAAVAELAADEVGGTAPAAPRPVARIAVLYALGAGILTVTNTLIVVLVVQTFGQGAGVLGVIDSLAGVGVVLAAILYKRVSRRYDQVAIALVGYLCCALFVVLNPLLGIAALALLYPAGSVCFGIARVAARTMLMDAASEHTVGRVFGAATAAGLAFSLVATLVITRITDRIGIATGYLVFGVIVAAVTLLGWGLLRQAGYRFPPPSSPKSSPNRREGT
jgi:hypothetical protein